MQRYTARIRPPSHHRRRFFGFGLAFNVGLGQYDWNYATFDRSFLGLFFRFIEGMRLEPSWFESYSGASGLVGPLLALAFLILVTFVLGNVFMAIVLEAYVSGLVARGACAWSCHLSVLFSEEG